MRGWIAFQFVSHKSTWANTLPFHKLTEEPHRSLGITTLLNEYVDNIAVLINGAIEIVLFPANADEHLVYIPSITMLAIPPTQASCVSGSEFQAPPSDRFV